MFAASESSPAGLHVIQAIYSHGGEVDYTIPIDLNGSELASLQCSTDSEFGMDPKDASDATDIETQSDREYSRQMREWRQELDEQLHMRSPLPTMIANLRRDSYSSSASTVPDGIAFSPRKSLTTSSSMLLPQSSQTLPPLGGLSLAPIVTTADCFVPPLALPAVVITNSPQTVGVSAADASNSGEILEQQQQQQQQQLNRKVSIKLEISKRFNKFKTFLERSLTSSVTPTASSSSPMEERTPMAESPEEYDYTEVHHSGSQGSGDDFSDDDDEEEDDVSSSELSTTSSLSTHAVADLDERKNRAILSNSRSTSSAGINRDIGDSVAQLRRAGTSIGYSGAARRFQSGNARLESEAVRGTGESLDLQRPGSRIEVWRGPKSSLEMSRTGRTLEEVLNTRPSTEMRRVGHSMDLNRSSPHAISGQRVGGASLDIRRVAPAGAGDSKQQTPMPSGRSEVGRPGWLRTNWLRR
ncbi:hypothetical protein HDU83_007675 [Entophlyctis luteolus]|nr:hypothetical protein HDU83_007675 [Entophlyctis luteolus]